MSKAEQPNELLTHSRQASFKTCRKQNWYAYEQGIRRVTDSRALRMGTAYHAGVEQLGKGLGLAAACEAARDAYYLMPENHDEYEWAIECETVVRLLCGYEWRWSNVEIKDVATEQSFELPLRNPQTNKTSRLFNLAGKIDGIVELEDGRLAVKECKLLGDDISDDSDLWPRLRIDPQISQYVVAARRLGFKVDCVLYDVARKPTIGANPIPLLDENGLKIVCDAAGNRVRNKSKQVPALDENGKKIVVDANGERVKGAKDEWRQTADPAKGYVIQTVEQLGEWKQTADSELGYVVQTRPMTPEEWGERLAEDIATRPEFYFARREIARIDGDLEEYESETWDVAKSIRDAQLNGRWYRTASKNTCDFCAFFSLCTSCIDVEKGPLPDGFVRVEDVHPELERKKEHGIPATSTSDEVTAPAADIRTADLAVESAQHSFVPYF